MILKIIFLKFKNTVKLTLNPKDRDIKFFFNSNRHPECWIIQWFFRIDSVILVETYRKRKPSSFTVRPGPYESCRFIIHIVWTHYNRIIFINLKNSDHTRSRRMFRFNTYFNNVGIRSRNFCNYLIIVERIGIHWKRMKRRRNSLQGCMVRARLLPPCLRSPTWAMPNSRRRSTISGLRMLVSSIEPTTSTIAENPQVL